MIKGKLCYLGKDEKLFFCQIIYELVKLCNSGKKAHLIVILSKTSEVLYMSLLTESSVNAIIFNKKNSAIFVLSVSSIIIVAAPLRFFLNCRNFLRIYWLERSILVLLQA